MLLQKLHKYVALSTVTALTLSGLNAPVAAGQSSNFGMSSFQAPSGATAHMPQDEEGTDGNFETRNEEVLGDLVPGAQGDKVDFIVNEDDLDATVTTHLSEDGHLTVEVSGVSEGEHFSEIFDVQEFAVTGQDPDDFVATLTGQTTAQSVLIDGQSATTQAVPALVILGLLARAGLRAALNWYGKAQVKKAAKSYLLSRNANSWRHIMAPKHCWSRVGGHSREQVAELMSRAMSEGVHGAYGAQKKAEWKYKNQTIVVTYSNNGHIGNGWVKC
ncbi:MAG: SAR2788 family putative toxin [Corynebacterium casei]|nr:SAR2788 family putative toxin [Corynebacterium casei]HCM79914.1 hypothetical protein [Corynebacterium stationis]